MINFYSAPNYEPEKFDTQELSSLQKQQKDVRQALLALGNEEAKAEQELLALLQQVITHIEEHNYYFGNEKCPLKDRKSIFEGYIAEIKNPKPDSFRYISNLFVIENAVATLIKSYVESYQSDTRKQVLKLTSCKYNQNVESIETIQEKLTIMFQPIIDSLKKMNTQLAYLEKKSTEAQKLYGTCLNTICENSNDKLNILFKQALKTIIEDVNQVLNNSPNTEADSIQGIRGICNELLSNPTLNLEKTINEYYPKNRRKSGYADKKLVIIKDILFAHKTNLNTIYNADFDEILGHKASQDALSSSLIDVTNKIIDNMVNIKQGRSYFLGSYRVNDKKDALIQEIRQLEEKRIKNSLETDSIITAYNNIKKICAQKRNPLGFFAPHSAKEFDELTTVIGPANRSITKEVMALSNRNDRDNNCLISH